MKSWEYEQAIIDILKEGTSVVPIYYLTGGDHFRAAHRELTGAGIEFTKKPPIEACGSVVENDLEFILKVTLDPRAAERKVSSTDIVIATLDRSWINWVNLFQFNPDQHPIAHGIYKVPKYTTVSDYSPTGKYFEYLTKRIEEGSGRFQPAEFTTFGLRGGP